MSARAALDGPGDAGFAAFETAFIAYLERGRADLAVAAAGRRLAPDLRFFYQADEPAGQTELLAGTIRRHLPGQAGRARAAEHLRRETADLMARQIGRARADLQYRLQEAARRLARVIDDRYEQGTGRLEKALADAEGLKRATATELAARESDVAARITAIDQVLALLDSLAAPPPGVSGAAGDMISTGGGAAAS
jgi:hypothetical protein